ncbi:MAG: DUF1588 domain-containing protein [Pirellulaceae bacterium]|nr:DUF1588 domain-containing protein [Pirellulaceae bacterium]
MKFPVLAALVGLAFAAASLGADSPPFEALVKPFLAAHCTKCHGPRKQEAELRLDDLKPAAEQDWERWSAIRDQLREGLMPPADEPRPNTAQARAVIEWIAAQTSGHVARLPNQGNLIAHELLFGPPAEGTAASSAAPRLWRLSPEGYLGFVRDVHRGRADGIVQPFTLIPERGIKDYAGLYAIDEASTEILLRNAAVIVEGQSAHEFKDGKLSGKNDTVRELVQLMHPTTPPTPAQLSAAVQAQFRLAIGRAATDDETHRFLGLYEKCAVGGDHRAAAKIMLQAILLRTDAMYRSEIGGGQADGLGRRMLAPRELARALSLALTDRRDSTLLQVADKGELANREQVADQIERMWSNPKIEKPRLLRFFRQYFEYDRALDVFKDKPPGFVHEPRALVADTDRLVLHILAEDRDVFRRLLTTPRSFVNFVTRENKQTRVWDVPAQAVVLNPNNNKGQQGLEYVYGIPAWTPEQPVTMPAGTRLGILMQPSWLIAFSTNFENDPVRRGRWIRERLLGGTVPDLPIGVVAQVPDEPHRTFRDRLTVTRAAQCWKCHQKMDELGLPFENFDHFGRFRTTETVHDPEATAKNVDKKGQPLGPVTREVELLTTGLIADSGFAALDGPVADPRELVTKIAASERARQVFVRHVFRYFLGRNESLSDARTLQAADRAYVESDGSFRALVTALLTSDSFLYRYPSPTQALSSTEPTP